MASNALEDFLEKVRSIQSLMVLVSTGRVEVQEKEKEYAELRDALMNYFQTFTMTNPNNFETLLDFYGYYRSKMQTYEERRNFVKNMYENTERRIESMLNEAEKSEEVAHDTPKLPKATIISEEKTTQDPQKILVIYGRNEEARLALFTFLRAVGLHPFEWSELVKSTGKGSPHIYEILKKGFSEAKAVVVLMTPDDEGKLRAEFIKEDDLSSETELTPQARSNVIFEAGMALGLCAERTILVELGALRPFSDIAGLHVVRLDNSISMRQELAQRLLTLGCAAALSGTDWHKAGDFKIPVVS